MANKAGIGAQSKRQKERREEEIKLHIFPQSWGCLCSLPQVQPATEDITARLVIPSVKTPSSSVLYKQQKQQKISRLLPSASRISHSWELRDQRQQRRNILFLTSFISALLISFPSHTSPLLLEVLMTSCSLSTSISGSKNLLAREVYKQHCKDRLSSTSEQVMRTSQVIPSPHCPNFLEKGGLRRLWPRPYRRVQHILWGWIQLFSTPSLYFPIHYSVWLDFQKYLALAYLFISKFMGLLLLNETRVSQQWTTNSIF